MHLNQTLQALQALRELRSSLRTASGKMLLQRRIAVRWLEAGLASTFDVLIRLAVLEGAAGVPQGAWVRQKEAGLATAQKHFEESVAMDPEWFQRGKTGAYDVAVSKVGALARKAGMDPSELIANAVYGIGLHGDPVKSKIYTAGVALAEKILSGEESPRSVMIGKGGKYIQHGALNEIKYKRRTQTKTRDTDDGPGDYTETVAAPTLDRRDIWPLLARIWLSKSDPLGRTLRALMKKAWEGWKLAPGMEQWLDESVKRGHILDTSEIQEILDIKKPVWLTNYYKPGFSKVAALLRSSPRLFSAIVHRLLGAGFDLEDLDFDISRVPPPEHINPKRLPSGTRDMPKVKITGSVRDYPDQPPF